MYIGKVTYLKYINFDVGLFEELSNYIALINTGIN